MRVCTVAGRPREVRWRRKRAAWVLTGAKRPRGVAPEEEEMDHGVLPVEEEKIEESQTLDH